MRRYKWIVTTVGVWTGYRSAMTIISLIPAGAVLQIAVSVSNFNALIKKNANSNEKAICSVGKIRAGSQMDVKTENVSSEKLKPILPPRSICINRFALYGKTGSRFVFNCTPAMTIKAPSNGPNGNFVK